MFRNALRSFRVLAALLIVVLAMQPLLVAATTTVATYTVFVGTGNEVYDVVTPAPAPAGAPAQASGAVAKDPPGCGLAVDGTVLESTVADKAKNSPCHTVAVAPSTDALGVQFVLSFLPTPAPKPSPSTSSSPGPTPPPTPTPSPSPCGAGNCFTSLTPIDNVVQGRIKNAIHHTEDLLEINVAIVPCKDDGCTGGTPSRAFRFTINPDLHLYATDTSAGRTVLLNGSSVTAADETETETITKPVNVLLLNDGRTPLWAGTLSIPWRTLKLGYGRSRLEISASRTSPDLMKTEQLTTGKSVIVDMRAAFGGASRATAAPQAAAPRPAPPPTLRPDATQRYAVASWVAQYDETRFAVSQRPDPAGFTPPEEVPLSATFPRVQGDANLPLTQQFLVGLTVAQNNTKPASLQKSIVAGATAALVPAKTVKSFKCGTCKTFQDQYAAPFTLPGADTALPILAGADVGQNELAYNLSKVGDLDVGHSTTYANGDLQLGIQNLFGSNPPDKFGYKFTHHVAGAAYTNGPFTVNGVYVSANADAFSLTKRRLNDSAPPTPVPSSTPLFVTPAAPPHTANLAISLTDSELWTTPSGNAQVGAVIRNAFDLTNKTSSGFLGSQYTARDATVPRRVLEFQAGAGYRWSDVGYGALAGDPVTYPGVAGAAFAFSYSRKYDDRLQPSFGVNAFRLSNPAGDGVSSVDAKIGYDFTPYWGMTFESSNVRVSEPLLAIQGDPTLPYPAADAAIMILETQGLYSGRPRFLPLQDNTVSVVVKYKKAKIFGKELPVNLSLGYDFYRITSECGHKAPTGLYDCHANSRSAVITAGGWTKIDKFTIAGSYVPSTFFDGTQRAAPQDRVYNVFVGAQFSDCVSAVITASNDTQTLFNSIFPVKRSFAAELDIQQPFIHLRDAHPAISDLTTLTLGYSATDEFVPSINVVAAGSGFIQRLFPSRRDTLYVKLRVGTRPFKQKLAPTKCTALPASATPSAKAP